MRLTPAKRLRPASVSEVLQPGEEVTSVSNAEQNFTSISQISETQQVGTRAWTIECREDVHQKLEELSSRFGKLEADLSALKKTLAPSHIRNLAAQVLLHAVAPLELSETDHRFQDLAKQHYKPLLDFAEQLAVRPALLAARADALIKRRNKTIHSNVHQAEVKATQGLLDSQPDLRTDYKHETEILANYDLLQNCFKCVHLACCKACTCDHSMRSAALASLGVSHAWTGQTRRANCTGRAAIFIILVHRVRLECMVCPKA